ncbi:MAG TPA: hypothetical protein VED18_08095 [Candidatus Sulfotelmatobacter sp.]|nr:hypothetical protein [Candidatus Sulfotelmatobacter sp.]
MRLETNLLPRSAVFLALVAAALGNSSAALGEPEPRLPAELLARAEAEGSVRVIVELRTGPGGIAAAQDAALHALEGTAHRVTRRYESIPFIGLEVSAEALRRLGGLSAVLRIQEDRVVAPQTRTP